MTCSLFIKSYAADFEWLSYSLRSIARFAKGFSEIIVVVPNGQNPPTGTQEKVFKVHEALTPYLFQQSIKLHADAFTDADYILYQDSDTIFTRPITPADVITPEGKVRWLYTPYASLNDPNTHTWKTVVKRALGFEPEFEFMRRHPLCAPRWALQGLRDFFWKAHGMSLESYINAQPGHEFSEWNVLAAWLWQHHRDRIEWQNTDVDLGVPFVHQHYSYGGLNDDIRRNMEAALA